MEDRQVTHTKKDKDGDILALCQPGQYWSPRWKSEAIADIESGRHQYHVNAYGISKARVRVVQGMYGKYLRTDADSTSGNNLDNLPDC